MEAVLRLLRGVASEDLSREFEVTERELIAWRDEFLEAGMLALTGGDGNEPAIGAPAKRPRRQPSSTAGSPDRIGWREQEPRRAHGKPSARPGGAQAGLRERKKARTRAAIREHAMRLFREHGYAETTVNQIAEAAEVSPSTFFRYFATKEDVVFEDEADAMLAEKFDALPQGLSPVRMVFRALLEAMASTSEADAVREQVTLSLTVPELRAALFDKLAQLMNEIAELVAERENRKPSDLEVRTFAAAVQGVWYSVLFDWADDPHVDLEAAMMEAATLLESGLPL